MTTRQLLKKFGKHLNKRRLERKWSLRAMATNAKIPHVTLHAMEQGRLDPPLSRLMKLASVFGEDVTVFLSPIVQKRKNPEG